MPELPEVETVARGLQRAVAGLRIVGVTLGKSDFIDDAELVERELPGRRIERVSDFGKFLLLRAGSEGPRRNWGARVAGAPGDDGNFAAAAGERGLFEAHARDDAVGGRARVAIHRSPAGSDGLRFGWSVARERAAEVWRGPVGDFAGWIYGTVSWKAGAGQSDAAGPGACCAAWEIFMRTRVCGRRNCTRHISGRN